MVPLMDVRTPRLWLRPWRDEDVEPFAVLNADPRVMEFFPALLTCQETEAVEVPGVAPFVGLVGLTTRPGRGLRAPARPRGPPPAPARAVPAEGLGVERGGGRAALMAVKLRP